MFSTKTKIAFNLKKSILTRVYFFSLLPVTITLFISIAVQIYYAQIFEAEAMNNHLQKLGNVALAVDSIFYELHRNNYFISSSYDFLSFLHEYNMTENPDKYIEARSVSRLLFYYKSSKDFIDSVFFYFPNGIIIDSSGTSNPQTFFSKTYLFDEYPYDFWNRQIKRRESWKFQILKPSDVLNSTATRKKVIPVIYRTIGVYDIDFIFVVNIDYHKLSQMISGYKASMNTNFYIFDETGNVLCSTETDKSRLLENIPLITGSFSKSPKEKTGSFVKGHYMYLMLKPNSFAHNLTYAAVTHKSDFVKQTFFFRYLIYTFSLFLVIVSLTVSYIVSRKIYTPIGSLIRTLHANNNPVIATNFNDEFDYINNRIFSLLDSSEQLTRELSFALPLLHEQYLFFSLNPNVFNEKESVKKFLDKHGLDFKYPHFVVSLMQMDFTKDFYQSYTEEEQINIYNGILNLIKNIFSLHCQVLSIAMGNNRLCIILNLREETMESFITTSFELIIHAFRHDEDMVRISVGIGRRKTDHSGLYFCYNEALSALTRITPFSASKIKTYEDECQLSHTFTVDEQNKLFNFLLLGNLNEAMNLIKEVVNTNAAKNITLINLKDLYLQFYNIGIQVLKKEGTPPQQLYAGEFSDLGNDYLHMTIEQISDYLTDFFQKITEHLKNKYRHYEIKNIKDYIEKNYTQDIYLSMLAEKYKLSVPYLSQLLTEELGMNFSVYLASLRINKAKELLSKTKMNLDEIAIAVGFNSRNTLIRMFKKMEGIKPSEYKKAVGQILQENQKLTGKEE